MSDETQVFEPPDKSFDDLLAECIAAEEAGRRVNRDSLIASYPHFAEDLEEFFANREQMRRLASPLLASPGSAAEGGGLGTIRYFGDYELIDEIAAGGMGIVYKARQVSLNRIVAVKMILKGSLANDDDVRRFRAEAEAAAGLQHPGIVAIHEIGLHEGQHYFSMDYVEGNDLAQLIRKQPLSSQQAAEYLRAAAETVHYAHQQGTLHRDIKPSNILIDSQNRVRITDFGLAKRIENQSALTLTGQVLGTPSYMPPEQALGKRSLVSAASDVYSLGAVLYEMLTGRPPFRGETALETLKLLEAQEPVAPRLLNPGVARDLETICLKCLQKEPARRYSSAQALADDLGRFLRGDAIQARPVSLPERTWRWSKRNPLVAALLLVSGILATLVYLRELGRRQEAEAAQVILTQKVAELNAEKQNSSRLQQDVQSLETRDQELNASLRVNTDKLKDVGQRLFERSMQLAATAWNDEDFQLADYHLEQCPSELRNAEWRELKAKCYPESTTLIGKGKAVMSPDGKWLATLTGEGQIRVSSADGKKGVFTSPISAAPVSAFSFSPDSKVLAIANQWKLRIWQLPKGTLTREMTTRWAITDVRFSPNGKQLAAACREYIRIDQYRQEERGTVVFWNASTLEEQFELPGSRFAVFNRDGQLFASLQTPAHSLHVWKLPADGSPPSGSQEIPSDPLADCRPAFHPEHNELAYACRYRPAIETWDVDRGLVIHQIPTSSYVGSLAFSKNGKRLAYSTNRLDVHSGVESFRVTVLNVLSQRKEQQLPWFLSTVTSLSFTSNEQLLVADAHRLTRWNVPAPHDPTEVILSDIAQMKVQPRDWPQWGGSRSRVNTPLGTNIPAEWSVGAPRHRRYRRPQLDPRRGYVPEQSQNVKWAAATGSHTYGNPVVANGRVFVGTNNAHGYLRRYPADIDLGVLLCLDERTGDFFWQHSNEKLPTGRVHDWPMQGVCSTPLVDGDRLWYVSNRGEVLCLDTAGFHDGEDDGIVDHVSHRLPLHLHEQLRDWQTTRRWVADLVREAGFRWLPAWSVGAVANQRWHVHDNALKQDVLILEVVGDRFEIRRPGLARGELVHSHDNRLLQGLDQGRVSPALRMALGAFAIELVDETLRQTTPASWTLQTTARDVVALTQRDNHFTVRYPLATHHRDEADVVWRLDMMKELGVSQHNMANCSVLAADGRLFVCTSNGVDEAHVRIPAPEAPSFIAVDQRTGKLLWRDNSPGENILHSQWASPGYGVIAGQPQVIFPGGDGWVYSFAPEGDGKGGARLLWKFDANPKTTAYNFGGRGTRNEIISFPAIYDGLVYIVTGQDPEHGEGSGNLWCINPAGHLDGSDISLDLAVDPSGKVLPPRRVQAVLPENGERAVPNPKSAVIWNYSQRDQNGDGEIAFEEEFHRSLSIPAIKDNMLYIADFSGLFHCLNAKAGEVYWTYDLLAACWSSALIVDGKVYIGDEDGDVAIFRHTTVPRLTLKAIAGVNGRTQYAPADKRWNPDLLAEINTGQAIYMTPIVANDVLYISSRDTLYAIANMSPYAAPKPSSEAAQVSGE